MLSTADKDINHTTGTGHPDTLKFMDIQRHEKKPFEQMIAIC